MQRSGLALCLTAMVAVCLVTASSARAEETCQEPTPPGSVCDPAPGLRCCDPAEEPGFPDAQFCPNGHACCEDGSWRCNDDTGRSTCTTVGPVCERCCDPTERPTGFDCDEGATCCADGSWRCNSGDGTSTCPREGVECPLQCCDPSDEPGAGDNPPCIEGAKCCSTGDWRCNNGAGDPTCAVESAACENCCDPFDEPGRYGNASCIEGATCCASGDWTCNAGDGTPTCQVAGIPCERCCDARDQPGRHDNPPCPDIDGEGQAPICCTSGLWECNDPLADTSCNPGGTVCAIRCCDPRDEPGAHGNPPCIEGATCCGDGRWACDDATGTPTCAVESRTCERCCDPLGEPGRFGNPTCFEGATCCATGEWQCNDNLAGSTCGVDGTVCDRCCNPADEPGIFGNPACATGATCCSGGRWECNDNTGASTCPLDGAVCGAACCDGDERPNQPGTPFCATGFECWDDGQWMCNDSDGNPTCEGDISFECPDICGGIAGIPCDDGEFCKFGVGECCCDLLGVCEPIPDACPLVYDPVCGCDGVTYGNECEADRAGVPIESRGACEGQVCGGIQGLECPEGQFCKLRDGECCCDFQGVCRNIPEACPEVWDPVCGCDGVTYGNECEASAAGVSVLRRGECESPIREVDGVHFAAADIIRWEPEPEALAYNVYLMRFDTLAPVAWRCAYSGVRDAGTTFPGVPTPGPLWWIQVTALFPGGEGPMGSSSNGRPRGPIADCPCTLPADPGPCDAAIPRWYHDFVSGACEMFIYGGCEGNANNFESQEACEASCRDTCRFPAETGDCEAAIRRWFHDPLTSECHPFVWGGCGGNENNFETFAECQQACDDVCVLPPDVGPCDGVFPRWFHNASSGECEEFIWGGCGGNGNNFETLPECQRACTDVCGLPPDVGPCDGDFPRWYHNADTGECELFSWGGCEGNGNNFETRIECQATCVDVCELPPETGPCTAVIERWYHNADTGECETFIWGGCGGNANNFTSKYACENRCP